MGFDFRYVGRTIRAIPIDYPLPSRNLARGLGSAKEEDTEIERVKGRPMRGALFRESITNK